MLGFWRRILYNLQGSVLAIQTEVVDMSMKTYQLLAVFEVTKYNGT